MVDRLRARILRIGTVEPSDEGLVVRGFQFAAPPGTVIPLYQTLPDGSLAFCGWTAEELRSVVDDERALHSGRIGVEEIVG